MSAKIHEHDVFDAEASFFCRHSDKPMPVSHRYDVLLIKDGTPYVGKVITSVDIYKWCEVNGYSIGYLNRVGIAMPGERTELT